MLEGHTPFVGRQQELTTLEHSYQRAIEGQPQIVFVSGDTGIGKSRLIGEFVAGLKARAALVLRGGSPVLVGAEVPYGPVAGALSDLRGRLGTDALDVRLGEGSQLSRLLPDHRAPADVNPRFGQLQLFEQFIGLLASLGGEYSGGVVVVLEDLHWADVSTRELLAFIVRNMNSGRVVVIATFRTDGGGWGDLRRLLTEAVRQSSVVHLELDPLGQHETLALVTAAGGQKPTSALESVAARSGGNPLFAEHLLSAPPGPGLPGSLVNLLLDQLRGLSKPAIRLLRLAATEGPSAPAVFLEPALAALGEGLVDVVDEVRGTGILRIEETDAGVFYVFRHALLQEVVYGEVIPTERAQMHRLMAQVMMLRVGESSNDPGAVAALARHWWAAGELAQAYPWLVRAASLAEQVFAFSEAATLYERAVEAFPYATRPEQRAQRQIGYRPQQSPARDGMPERSDLYARAAHAASLAGQPERALTLIEAALKNIPTDSLLLSRRAQFLWETGRRTESVEGYLDAVAGLTAEPTEESAAILRAAARILLLVSRYGEARDLAEQALAAARAVRSERNEQQALLVLGAALAHTGDVPRALDVLTEARALQSRRRKDSRLQPSRIVDLLAGYWSSATILAHAGESEASAAAALEGVREAQNLGVDQGWGGLVGAAAVERLIALGRWGEAEALLNELLERPPSPAAAGGLHAVGAYLLALTGRIPEGLRELDLARQVGIASASDDDRGLLLQAKAAAEISWATNQLSEGSRAVAEALELMGANSDAIDHAELLGLSLRLIADRAQLARWLKAPAEIALLEQQAVTIDGELVALAPDNGPTGAPNRVLEALVAWGHAEFERAKGTSTTALWIGVADQWERLHEPFRAAFARWIAAEHALGEKDQRGLSRDLLARARETCVSLGAEPLRQQIDALARRARMNLDVIADQKAAAPDPPQRDDRSLGLSTRELEVLTLVAEGHTNRQIAETLFISEKTAGHHVSSILGKLGVGSRVEAAAIAVRAGLASAPEPAVVPQVVPGSEADPGASSNNRERLTMVFTDIVMSTALLEAIGDDAWSDLLTWHDSTLRALFKSYGGEEIDHAGDGFLVVFRDVGSAIDCSVTAQRTMGNHRQQHGFAPRLRIAVHTGDVIRKSKSIQGRAVHEAARIVGAAAGDEILTSLTSLTPLPLRYSLLEPRQVAGTGLKTPVSVVPVRWQVESPAGQPHK